MIEDWILCYQADEEYKVEIIKQLLENQGLHPVIMDHKDSEFRLGNVELFTAPEEHEKAIQLIKENQQE